MESYIYFNNIEADKDKIMNREIKFRVWSGGEFRYDIDFIALDEDYHITGWNDLIKNKELKIQQYTGLKDKNGKEIYEGDIVQLSFGNFSEKCVVEYDKYSGFKYDRGGWTSLVHVDKCGEVIGNIFENEDLLK